MLIEIISSCKSCKHYKAGYCKKVKFNVSVNSNWCEHFNLLFRIKVKEFFKRLFHK